MIFRQDSGSTLPLAKRGEDLLKMQLLTSVGDINDFIRPPGLQPIRQRGQVRGGVIKSTVALADERRLFLESRRRGIVEENGQRAFAFARDAFSGEFFHQRFEPRIVKTFAKRVIELHTEPGVNRV